MTTRRLGTAKPYPGLGPSRLSMLVIHVAPSMFFDCYAPRKTSLAETSPANEIVNGESRVADLQEADQYKPLPRLIVRSASGDTLTGRPSGSVIPIAE